MAALIRVLIIGFKASFRHQLRAHMPPEEYFLEEVDVNLELTAAQVKKSDVALLDMTGCEQNSTLRHLDRLQLISRRVQVICAVPAGQVKLSMVCMKHGAFDEIQLPVAWSLLREKIKAAYQYQQRVSQRLHHKTFWRRLENHWAAGGLAQAGAPDMALKWLEKTGKKPERKPSPKNPGK